MPVPKRKRSRARRDKRFANKGIQPQQFTSCDQCKSPIPPHQVCKECGFYKGVRVITTKVERRVKRAELQQTKATSKKAESSAQSESEE